jgi:hypothetical protein
MLLSVHDVIALVRDVYPSNILASKSAAAKKSQALLKSMLKTIFSQEGVSCFNNF